MPTKTNTPAYGRAEIPEADRCRFTSSHGNRCANPHNGAEHNFCPVHERRAAKLEDAKAREVYEQLLSGGPNLSNRQEVGRAMAQLFILISQKRISRRDGVLLAYVASLLLQTMLPMNHKRTPEELRAMAPRIIFDMPGPSRERFPDHENPNAQDQATS